MRPAAFALVLLLAACDSAPAPRAGDAASGEKLHRSCLQCHGTEAYVPPHRKVQSLDHLRRETERWADHYNPKPTSQEIEDLVAYLNRDFYRFAQ